MSVVVPRRSAREYMGLASVVLAYTVLGVVWWAVGRQFWASMAPRLGHLGPGGMRVIDWPGAGPQADFSAFWPAGILARAGQVARIYDPAAFLAYRQMIFTPAVQIVRWYYPPVTLLPAMAVSFLPFEAGFWFWTITMNVLAIGLLRLAKLDWVVIAVGLLSPAALWNMEFGQFGALTGALVVSALMLAARAPIWAGFVLGCLALKPQGGLLAGVSMLTRRCYLPVFGIAVVSVLALAGLVTAILGWQLWPEYLGPGLVASKRLLEVPPWQGGGNEAYGVSVFWAVRMARHSVKAAYIAQAVVTGLSALAVGTAWRLNWGDLTSRMALTVFLSLLATPYGYTYDMVAYQLALAACAQARGWRIDVLDAALFLAPAICPLLVEPTGWLLTPLAAAAAGGRALFRAAPPTRPFERPNYAVPKPIEK